MTNQSDQFGFDALLAEADADNQTRAFEKDTAHLSGNIAEAVEFHRDQIDKHHAAMLDCAFERALAIRTEAHLLARKLNGGDPGILAGDDAPGYIFAQSCAAKPDTAPLWGQDGVFDLAVADCRLRVTMHGMFGIGATAMSYLGFEVRAVEPEHLFLSSTGYRSFLGCSVPPHPGLNVEGFVRQVVEHHINADLKGRLVPIGDVFRARLR